MPEFVPVLRVTALNGTNGFRIDGDAGTAFGNDVTGIGDVNGDGRVDLLIAAEATRAAYIAFGTAASPAVQTIAAKVAAGTAYFILGEQPGDHTGRSVANAGDVNGDGINDILVGAYQADPDGKLGAGATYLIFGGAANLEALDQAGTNDGIINLSSLNGTRGYRLDGNTAGDASGICVSGAGDVNGDGFNDLLVGAPYAETAGHTNNGISYLVYGGPNLVTLDNGDGLPDGQIDLSKIATGLGVRLDGEFVNLADASGQTVSGAGDANGDGFVDFLISAPGADPNSGAGNANEGASYLVFGRSSSIGFPSPLGFDSLGLLDFVRFDGDTAHNGSSFVAGGAGDINADGIADLAFGTQAPIGSAYVVFGKTVFASSMDLAALNGSNGFRLDGIRDSDFVGNSVASGGDVNGDGFGDLIIGAADFDRIGSRDTGAVYVLFGKAHGFASSIDLGALDGNDGFRIEGAAAQNALGGRSVKAAGDLNGDGFSDIVVGAYGAGADGNGAAYAIYGHRPTGSVTREGTDIANRINGGSGDDQVSGFDGGDTLLGWEGSDTLNGGSGADSISAGTEDDQVLGGSGNDTVDAGTGDDTADGGAGNDILNGGADDDILRGGSGNDTIDGSNGDDLTNGAGGNDFFYASAGDDTVQGGSGVDLLAFGSFPAHGVSVNLAVALNNLNGDNSILIASIENLSGTNFDDTLAGNGRANTLQGAGGNDTLNGGAGVDVLLGGPGNDSLTGGLNADTFDFGSPLAGNVDTISDFVHGADFIRLRQAIFTVLPVGALAAGAFNTGTAATQADDRIIYNTTSHALLYDADGFNGVAGIQFAIIQNGVSLSNTDFVVV